MLLCNISSDKVYIGNADHEIFLERNGIENTLGPTLIEWNNDSLIENVFLINGPGGFTNLRVGTLTFNLLAHLFGLENRKLRFFSCTKIDLYRFFVKKSILPSVGYIYLGQKNNVWKYDFKKDIYEMKQKPFSFEKESFCDFLSDSYYWGENFSMIGLGIDEKGYFITWNNQNYYFTPEDLGLQESFAVSPEYFIDPTIGA